MQIFCAGSINTVTVVSPASCIGTLGQFGENSEKIDSASRDFKFSVSI